VRVCAFVTAFIGLFVLLGWALGFNDVTSLGKRFVPMAEETAFLFLLTGIALVLISQKTRNKLLHGILIVFAVFIGVIALLTLIDSTTGYRWNISDIFGRTNTFKAGIVTGKMSWLTALCFVFVSVALLLLPTTAKKYSVVFSSLGLFVGYIIVVGYSYGVPVLYGGTTIPMAWPTAIAFIFSCAGLLFAAGKETAPLRYLTGYSTRARLLRNILPLVFLITVAHDFVDAFINETYNTVNSVTNSTVDVIVLIVVGVIISMKSKSIGDSIDKNISERKQAEEALKESKEQLRNFASNLQLVREDERTNLAREIHDSLAQYMVALKMDIGMYKKKLSKANEAIPAAEVIVEMDKLIVQVDNANKTARMIMNGLRPEQLELLGFVAAAEVHINDFMETHHINCLFKNGTRELIIDKEPALALFRILQESFNNVLKHSMANHITVTLASLNGNLEMEIVDDGVGFDVNHNGRTDSYGIVGMKERANLLGGNFEITSKVGKGTKVRVEIPYPH
jgi:signal transduction histidine kinase